jgi:parvulin-like peptidyl-prolyl isomerase
MARRRKIPAPTWEHQPGTLGRRLDANRWQLFATAGVVLLVLAALGVIGFGFLSDYIEDQNRPGSTAVKVEGREYSVRDFTRRAEFYVDQNGGQNQAFLVIPNVGNELIEEAILLQYATEEGVDATEEDIRAEIATVLGITAEDPNFDARFQEELSATGLSEEEYRDLARGRALKGKLTEHFKSEVPTTLPSVHYREIRVGDQAAADEIVAALEDGGDFATLYRENSLDFTEGDETGGDKGFVPEGFLGDAALEGVLFGLTPPSFTTYATSTNVLVIEVLEKSDIQEVTDEQKNRLAANAYTEWLDAKKDELDVTNEMDVQEGDSDKITYVIDHAELVLQ